MSTESFGAPAEGQKVGAGRFTLVRFLGQGSTGTVWLANDGKQPQQVALKFLSPEFAGNPGVLAGLRRDLFVASQLSHPHIASTIGFFEAPGETPFVAMEYVEGATLAAIKLQREKKLFSWDELRPFVQQLCAAMEHAHKHQLVHRDLKPSNLMLDMSGQLKVTDFGMAEAINSATGRMSIKNTVSTPTYVSPQQLKGERPQPTDDIYSFGATFYELLTSLPPFSSGDITYQVLHQPATPVSQRLDELKLNLIVPPEAGDLLLSCLAKDATRRPATFPLIAKWIFPSTIGEPEPELPPVRALSPWRWLRVVFIFLLLVGGGAGLWWKYGRPAPPETGWVRLFDGTTTDQWRGRDSDAFPAEAWRVDNGWLKPIPSAGPIARSSLISRERFKDFELEFDYVVEPGGNSGLLYRMAQPAQADDSLELNLLDDTFFAKQAARPNFERTGALWGILEPTTMTAQPAGGTNTVRLVVRAGSVQHWINGVIVLTYNWNNPGLKSTIAASPKGKTIGALLNSEAGHIALKNEEGVVSFRNIRIRLLTE